MSNLKLSLTLHVDPSSDVVTPWSTQRARSSGPDPGRRRAVRAPALVGASRVLTQEDIDAFAADARTQRVHDVVDALDYRIRKAV
jgi:hypothetical protein